MIITRSPLRITLGGGGTDLPSYYREHGGFLIAAAIDKYVYVTVMRPFAPGIYLKYSQLEHVDRVDEVQHPIIREAIKLLGFRTPQVEITTLADIPAGTGLGSSGSFTTALLKALYAHRRRLLAPGRAGRARVRDRDRPAGRADRQAGSSTSRPTAASPASRSSRTAASRPSRCRMPDGHALRSRGQPAAVLHRLLAAAPAASSPDQKTRTETTRRGDAAEPALREGARPAQPRGARSGRHVAFGELMHEHWEHKKRRPAGMSNPQIDEWYELGRKNGAIGGKLVGAGGGGFLMFYAEDHRRLRDRPWRRPVSKRCASGSTSKARRSCSREPAGRHSRRRAGHPAAADHRDDSEGARRGGRPAVCRASARLASRSTGSTASSVWSAIAAR